MIKTKIKLVIFLALVTFLSSFNLGSVVSAAERSDCNSTKNPQDCRADFDRCDTSISPYRNKNECQKAAVENAGPKNSGGNNNSGGGSGNGNGGSGAGNSNSSSSLTSEDKKQGYVDICGKDDQAVKVKFNFGCSGQVKNPIIDVAYTIIRFLSAGVGVFVVARIIIAGIRYTTAEGNPEHVAKAKNGVQSAIIALLLWVFAFSLIQYLVPGGVFR